MFTATVESMAMKLPQSPVGNSVCFSSGNWWVRWGGGLRQIALKQITPAYDILYTLTHALVVLS